MNKTHICIQCENKIPARHKVGERILTRTPHRVHCYICKPYQGDVNDCMMNKGVIWQRDARSLRKERLVNLFGGKCTKCGYNKCIEALEFHHEDRDKKKASLAAFGYTRRWEDLVEEAKKCILVCSNCHREIEHAIKVGNAESFKQQNSYIPNIYNTNSLMLLTKEEVQEGLSKHGLYELSEIWHIGETKLKEFCKKHNISIPFKKRLLKFEVSKEDLEKMILEKSFVQIGKIYGVSDNAIRKRCHKLGIKIRPVAERLST